MAFTKHPLVNVGISAAVGPPHPGGSWGVDCRVNDSNMLEASVINTPSIDSNPLELAKS